MPTPTYTALATTTISTTTTDVTFSSIPSSYRDLVLVVSVLGTNDVGIRMEINSDTGANYSNVVMSGYGPTNKGSGTPDTTRMFLAGWQVGMSTSGEHSTVIASLNDYSATDKHKSVLTRWRTKSSGGDEVGAGAGRWANTNAITTLRIFTTSGSFSSGTFSLFGIEA